MKFFSSLIALFFLALTLVKAQKVDDTFAPVVKGIPLIRSVYLQSNDKAIIGGEFCFLNGEYAKNLARINPDGTQDKSFNPSEMYTNDIMNVFVSTNNKTLILNWDGEILQLNEDGSLDNSFSFNPVNFRVSLVYPVESGYIISGYDHDNNKGFCIYKIKYDGTEDASFKKSYLNNVNGSGISDIEVLNNNKVLVVGNFTEFNEENHNRIVLLNSDGTIDRNFDTGSGFEESVYKIKIEAQKDKILLSGHISRYNKIDFPEGLLRLNYDGTIDETLIMGPVSGLFSEYPYNITVDKDDKILISGRVSDKVNYHQVYRLNENGSIDQSFSPIKLKMTGYDDLDLFIDSQKNIVAGTDFTHIDNKLFCGYAKFDAAGYLQENINPNLRTAGRIIDAVAQEDDKVIVIGEFVEINEFETIQIARLNSNGSVDDSFQPDFTLKNNDEIESIALQSDGQILLGGYFSEILNYNDLLLRLSPDGILDIDFKADIQALYVGLGVADMHIFENDKILIGGSFEYVSNQNRSRVALLNPDGSLDPDFNKNNVIEGDFRIRTLDVFKDTGHILLGGTYLTPTYNSIGKLMMLDNQGNLEPNFNLSNNYSSYINVIKVIDNTKFIYGGYPSGSYSYNITRSPVYVSDKLRQNIDSLSISGLHESNAASLYDFNSVDSANLIIGGYFTELNGFQNSGLTKVGLNGGVDIHFHFDVNGGIEKILKYDDDHILIFGKFSEINENPYYSAAKVKIKNYLPELPEEVEIIVMEDSIMNFTADDLAVYDEDDSISEISITYLPGENYQVQNNKVIPTTNYSGDLIVNARISDEKDIVDVAIKLKVLPVNDPPKIISVLAEHSIADDKPLTITADMFEINDPDTDLNEISVMPKDGANYWLEGNVVYVPDWYRGEITVYVTASDGIEEGNPFTFNVRVTTVTALDEQFSNSIKVFPNPVTHGLLNIHNDTQDKSIQYLRLCDLSGKTMISANNHHITAGANYSIYLIDINPGLYILSLEFEDSIVTKKIMIEN